MVSIFPIFSTICVACVVLTRTEQSIEVNDSLPPGPCTSFNLFLYLIGALNRCFQKYKNQCCCLQYFFSGSGDE